MNPESSQTTYHNGGRAALGYVLACLLFVVVVLAMKCWTRPAAIDADRSVVRTKALADVRAADAAAIETPGWIDQDHGVVRLPLSVALPLAERAWQDPSAARADLISRVEKATKPLPKAPAKPSQFE